MGEEEEEQFTPFKMVFNANSTKPIEYEQEGDDCLLTSIKLLNCKDKKPVKVYLKIKDYKDEASAEDAKMQTRKDELITLNKVDEEIEIEQYLPYSMNPSVIVEGNGDVEISGVFADKGMIQLDEYEEEYVIEEEDAE